MKKTKSDCRVSAKLSAAAVDSPDTDMSSAWSRDRKMGLP